MIRIESLHVYPVKSCRGVDLASARVTPYGLEHDREWIITMAARRFVTQREEPRLALINAQVTDERLVLSAPGAGSTEVPLSRDGEPCDIVVWRDRCAGRDQGEEVARWLTGYLGRPMRLVRFDRERGRTFADADTDGSHGRAMFADGYAMLVISLASLADLNSRLASPLPMNRFRPNIVVDGLPAYGEDDLAEIAGDGVQLRLAKACTRCAITTTNQQTGIVEGTEPLTTLKKYRWDRALRGVAFGQNAIVVAGSGGELSVGQTLQATRRLA